MFNLGTTSLFIRSKVKHPPPPHTHTHTHACAGHSSVYRGVEVTAPYTRMFTARSTIQLGVYRAQLCTPGCAQGTALYTWESAGHSICTPGCVQGTALYTWMCAEHSSIHLGVRMAQLYTPRRVQGTAYVHLGVCRAQLYTPGCVHSTALYTWVSAGHSSIYLVVYRAQLYTPGCVLIRFCVAAVCMTLSVAPLRVMFVFL